MKAFLVLLLLAVASCNTEIQEPELEFDVSGLIKCITEVAPLVPDVIEIINLIKAADWAQAATKIVELVSKEIPVVKECIDAFKKEINLENNKSEIELLITIKTGKVILSISLILLTVGINVGTICFIKKNKFKVVHK